MTVVLLTLVVTACGDLSVYDLLDSEEVGPFSMTQSSVNIIVGSEHRITAQGGYKEYRYEMLEGSAGDFDAGSSLYSAPASIAGDEDSAVVRGTDRFGSRDHTNVYVYNRLSVTPSAFFVEMDSTEITLVVVFQGGFGTKSVQRTELGNPASISGGNLQYTPISSGSDYVEIEDQKGNSVVIAVTVYDSSALFVDPTSQTAISGGSPVTFAVGGYTDVVDVVVTTDGGAYDHLLTWDQVQSEVTFDPDGAIETPQHIDILVTDAINTVTATVHVLASEPGQVAINPNSVELSMESSVELKAHDGAPPYNFEIASGDGSLIQLGAETVLFTAPSRQGVTRVRVTDDIGQTAVAQIKIRR